MLQVTTTQEESREEPLNESDENSRREAARGEELLKDAFNVVLLNARSMPNKIQSLKETLNELENDCAVITETWLKDCSRINDILNKFEQETPYKLIRRDRTGRTATTKIKYK